MVSCFLGLPWLFPDLLFLSLKQLQSYVKSMTTVTHLLNLLPPSTPLTRQNPRLSPLYVSRRYVYHQGLCHAVLYLAGYIPEGYCISWISVRHVASTGHDRKLGTICTRLKGLRHPWELTTKSQVPRVGGKDLKFHLIRRLGITPWGVLTEGGTWQPRSCGRDVW